MIILLVTCSDLSCVSIQISQDLSVFYSGPFVDILFAMSFDTLLGILYDILFDILVPMTVRILFINIRCVIGK